MRNAAHTRDSFAKHYGFADGSAFYLREFVDVEMTLAWLMYASINSSILHKNWYFVMIHGSP